ncbi:pro-neuregulin-3, membrane-bound isoform [Tachysurus ichikawai]
MDDSQACFLSRHRGLKDVILVAACHRLVRELFETDHLGIEFMESEEVYKRQVLSITSIAMGISFLGTLCMALYCRNKRRREKLQAHLKESRGLKNYSVSQPCKTHPGLQLHSPRDGYEASETSRRRAALSNYTDANALAWPSFTHHYFP